MDNTRDCIKLPEPEDYSACMVTESLTLFKYNNIHLQSPSSILHPVSHLSNNSTIIFIIYYYNYLYEELIKLIVCHSLLCLLFLAVETHLPTSILHPATPPR